MAEITSLRTYNTKFFDNNTAHCHAGHIHYKDTIGDFQDCDYTLEDMGTYWRIVKANYCLEIKKDFTASQLIRFDNKFDGRNHSIYYEPHSLRWVYNPDLSDMSLFRSAQSVTGQIVGSNVIRYTNAFGDGIHFEIVILRSGFKKEVIIDALNKLENPPTENHRLAMFSRYQGSGLKVIKNESGAQDWDESSYYEGDQGFRVEETGNRGFRSFVKKAYAVDADERSIILKVFWGLHNSSLWQVKIFPTKSQFQAASFPVRLDTTTSYYSGAGDGYAQGVDSSWDTSHDQTSADDVDYTSTTTRAGCAYFSAYYIDRSFFSFDTSGLPVDAVISAADLYLYMTSKYDVWNDGYDYLTVVEGLQADPTQLVADDYNDCGDSVDNPTEGSNQVDITGMSTGGYVSWTLDATGISWINKSGYTQLGLREGHDTEDVEYTGHGSPNDWGTQCRFSTSEETGTGQDPYLEIIYTVTHDLNSAISSKTMVLANLVQIFSVISSPASKTVSIGDLNVIHSLDSAVSGRTLSASDLTIFIGLVASAISKSLSSAGLSIIFGLSSAISSKTLSIADLSIIGIQELAAAISSITRAQTELSIVNNLIANSISKTQTVSQLNHVVGLLSGVSSRTLSQAEFTRIAELAASESTKTITNGILNSIFGLSAEEISRTGSNAILNNIFSLSSNVRSHTLVEAILELVTSVTLGTILDPEIVSETILRTFDRETTLRNMISETVKRIIESK